MDAQQLKAMQAPIKERYKSDPGAAVVTLRAEGRIGEGIACRLVATALSIRTDDGLVTAEGDLDFRGTHGVAKDAPVGLREIRLRFELDCDAPEEQKRKLIELIAVSAA